MGYFKTVGYRVLGLVLFFVLAGIVSTMQEKKEQVSLPTDLPTKMQPTSLPTLEPVTPSQPADTEISEQVKQNCVLWSEVEEETEQCIYGELFGSYIQFFDDPNGNSDMLTFFYFHKTGYFMDSFYFIPSFEQENAFHEGDCIAMTGNVMRDARNILYMDGKEQATSIVLCSNYVP